MTRAHLEELIELATKTAEPRDVITRLEGALWAVLEATGAAGEDALEVYCLGQEIRDSRNAG